MPKKEQHEENDQPKSKFKIVDRRRIDADSEPEPEEEPVKTETAKAESPKPPPSSDGSPRPDGKVTAGETTLEDETGEAPKGGREEDPLSFRNMALSFIQTLATVAWVHMGMVPHPQTQLIAKKMEEARKAIALMESINQQVKGELPPEISMQIAEMIRDLKANYVNQL
jgi:hypothetical protein